MSEHTSPKEASSWLKKLQAESWQAELVVSGIAIFGVFQVEQLVFDNMGWMVFYLPNGLESFHYFAVTYLCMAFAGLQVFFVFHFILRAFWVALLGVASVFPDGIREDNEDTIYSPAYLKAWKADFPDLQAYAMELDKTCSTQLSGAFTVAILGVSFAFWIVLCGLAYYFLSTIFPPKVLLGLGIAVLAFVAFFVLFSITLSTSSLKNSKFAKRYHYPVNRFFSKIIYMVFYRPFNYLVGAAQTNTGTKKVAAQVFLIPIFLGLLLGIKLIPILRNIPTSESRYFALDTEANALRPRNYADQYPNDQYVISPIMPSANWDQNQYFEFFVPLLTRERDLILEDCTQAEVPEEVEGNRRVQVRARRLTCYRESFMFQINGQAVNPIVKFQAYPLHSERGIWCYVEKPPFQEGENILTITHYWRNDDGERKMDNIPFYYLPSH